MDLLNFIETHVVFAVLLAPALLPLLALSLGPLHARVPALRRLGSPRVPLVLALWVFAVNATGIALLVRDLVAHTFTTTELGLVRGPAVDPTALADTLELLVGLQALAAIALLALVPAAVLATWRHGAGGSMLARVAPVVATAAIAAPVAAGAIGILALLDTLVAGPGDVVETTWAAANIIELGRWAILGLGAMGLMAATPIVVEAASRGHVIGRRAYAWTQVLFAVGFAAWALTRFCAEDVARGPVAHIAEGDVAALRGPAPTGIDPADVETLDLPRGAWCHIDEIDPEAELPVPLVLTHSLEGRHGSERFVGVASWVSLARHTLASSGHRRPVLVAALDLRLDATEFGPYLRAARDLGIEELAIVTFTDDRQQTLTLGEVYTRRPCVLVRTDLDHAHRYTLPGVWWGSLSHRLTEESIR